MPNWCDCELIVTGKEEDIKTFMEKAKAPPEDTDFNGEVSALDFNSFIPYPDKFTKMSKEAEIIRMNLEGFAAVIPVNWSKAPKGGYSSGGYEWCIDNWGTKWNACEVISSMPMGYGQNEKLLHRVFRGLQTAWSAPTPVVLAYGFQTAWSPPIPVVLAMSRMFPKLRFVLKYWEMGVGFRGYFRAKEGEVQSDKTYAYNGNRGG